MKRVQKKGSQVWLRVFEHEHPLLKKGKLKKVSEDSINFAKKAMENVSAELVPVLMMTIEKGEAFVNADERDDEDCDDSFCWTSQDENSDDEENVPKKQGKKSANVEKTELVKRKDVADDWCMPKWAALCLGILCENKPDIVDNIILPYVLDSIKVFLFKISVEM